MKKSIKIILIILFGIYLIFIKLDFLFFKVKICNNTNKIFYVELSEYQRDYLLEFYSYITSNDYHAKRVISFGNLNPNECSKYKNIHRIDNYSSLKALEYKDIDGDYFPNKVYDVIHIDTLGRDKKNFGKYTYNITGTKDIKNTFKGILYVEQER